MPKYRIPKHQKAMEFLYYELNKERETYYALLHLNHPNYNLSQLDVINEWRKFIASAFDESAESEMPCWQGHYDQFGIIMLYLIERASDHKAGNLKDEWFRDIDNFIGTLHDEITATGSVERRYYRAWLSLIGHPDFVHLAVSSDLNEAVNICKLHWLMGAALTRLAEGNLP